MPSQEPVASAACEWCGRAIAQNDDGRWYAVKGEERGYDPLTCEAFDDARHYPSDPAASAATRQCCRPGDPKPCGWPDMDCYVKGPKATTSAAERARKMLTALTDHPYSDPGDGRSECDVCGKWVWPVTHSCKGVPVTPAALARMEARRNVL